MKIALQSFVIILCIIGLVPPTGAFSLDGPLQVRNLFPLTLHAGQPAPERAALEDSLTAAISHSSTYLIGRSSSWSIKLDMEITEISLRYRRVVADSLELGISLPVLILSNGFMDGFLDAYHSSFGFPDYGRSKRPLNSFLYKVRRGGDLIVKGRNGIGPGDIGLSLKRSMIDSDRVNLSVKAHIELPTGDAKGGYGNGSVDAGLSVLADIPIREDILTSWNIGVVFPGRLKGYESVDLKDFLYGTVAVEALLGKRLGLVLQLQGHSRILPETGISSVDGNALLVSLGGRYYGEKGSLELSLTEDLNTTAAPDFILNIGYKIKLP